MFNCILNAPTFPSSFLTLLPLPPWLMASLSYSWWCFSLRIKSNGSSQLVWQVHVARVCCRVSAARLPTPPSLPRYSRHLAAWLIKRYFIAFWRLIMAKMGLEMLMERQTEDGKGNHKTRGSRERQGGRTVPTSQLRIHWQRLNDD